MEPPLWQPRLSPDSAESPLGAKSHTPLPHWDHYPKPSTSYFYASSCSTHVYETQKRRQGWDLLRLWAGEVLMEEGP